VENGDAGSGVDKGKSKAIKTSPRGGEKRKKVKKSAAVVVDNKIQEVAGPSKSGSGGSGNQAFLDRMDRLVESMGELTREVRRMRQAQRSIARSNNRVGRTLCFSRSATGSTDRTTSRGWTWRATRKWIWKRSTGR